MKKLRIAIFEPTRRIPGGGQKVMPRVAAYLAEKHHVTVFTQAQKQGEFGYGKSKIKIIKPTNMYLFYLSFLLTKIKKEDFDLIIYGCFPATLAAVRNPNLPSIHITNTPPRSFYDLRQFLLKNLNLSGKIKLYTKSIFFKRLDYLGARKANVIFCVSREVRKRIKKYYHRDCRIFHSGIYPEDYKSGKYENYILAPGRLAINKRPRIIVQAMKFVNNKDIRLVLVGSGDMAEEIKEMSRKYKNIEFKGFVSEAELKKLYSNCLAVVYIPINEDYGYVPVEAAASGKATIGVNEGGLKETIIDNKTGFLIDGITPEKLAEKIDFIANNKKLAIKMGSAAKKHSRKFYWKESFKVLDKTIEELTRKKK